MRRLLAMFVIVIAVAVPSSAACDREAELTEFLKAKHKSESLQLLAYDHLERRWLGYEWTNETLTRTDRNFEGLALGKPKLKVRDGFRPMVVVVNTNPIVFAAKQTAASQIETAELENLKALAAGIGNVVIAAVRAPEQVFTGPTPADIAVSGKVLKARPRALDRAENFDFSAKERGQWEQLAERLIREFEEKSQALGAQLNANTDAIATAVGTLNTRVGELARAVDGVAQNLTRVNSIAQIAENETGAFGKLGVSDALPGDLSAKFDDVQTQHTVVVAATTPCTSMIGTLKEAVELLLRGGTPSVPLAQQDYERLLVDTLGETCTHGSTGNLVRDLVQVMRRIEVGKDPATGDKAKVLIEAVRAFDEYLRVEADRAALVKKSGELIAKRDTAVASASSLVAFGKLIDGLVDNNYDICSARAGVIELARPLASTAGLSFGREGQETFSLARRARFKDAVELRHEESKEATVTFVRPHWIEPDFDFAVTTSSIVQPTFEAIDFTEERMVDTVDGPQTITVTRKKIGITKESKHEGAVAMMVSARFPRLQWVQWLTPQIGVGVNDSEPALFGGLAIALGPYIKFSGGRTWQRVTAPAKDQHVGMVLDGDVVRTRQKFDNDWYFALSLTLDDISFFAPRE